jgi:hypothetical protein
LWRVQSPDKWPFLRCCTMTIPRDSEL